jgi:hypothetical protein
MPGSNSAQSETVRAHFSSEFLKELLRSAKKLKRKALQKGTLLYCPLGPAACENDMKALAVTGLFSAPGPGLSIPPRKAVHASSHFGDDPVNRAFRMCVFIR